jgi:hypothetical protein
MAVLRLSELNHAALRRLLRQFGLEMRVGGAGAPIPASYWGESEAGLEGSVLFARPDTPLHSILHEAAHYVCMTPERRAGLLRDAGGDDAEECAVCYLQVLLAGLLEDSSRERLCSDMDEWGYSFRLGSARQWFDFDSTDAKQWLQERGIIDAHGDVSGQVRL